MFHLALEFHLERQKDKDVGEALDVDVYLLCWGDDSLRRVECEKSLQSRFDRLLLAHHCKVSVLFRRRFGGLEEFLCCQEELNFEHCQTW